jgi:rubrerythrin
MSYYEYDYQNDDNQRAEGYECKKCGYTPTYKELNRGSCPCCPRPKSTLIPEKENADDDREA